MPHARKDEISWAKGEYYHIYNRGAHHSGIFIEETNYLFVIRKMRDYAEELKISVIAYCLMPNHYHFLIRQNEEIPAGLFPQRLFNSYVKAYNKRYEHTGTMFERRFKAKHVNTYSYLLHLCRYIHANPVKDGLVAQPQDWQYSNYLEWIQQRQGVLVDKEFVEQNFASPQHYCDFVFDYLRNRQLPDDVAKYLLSLDRQVAK